MCRDYLSLFLCIHGMSPFELNPETAIAIVTYTIWTKTRILIIEFHLDTVKMVQFTRSPIISIWQIYTLRFKQYIFGHFV